MKNLIFAIAAFLALQACREKNTASGRGDLPAEAMTFPYKAGYSSDFILSSNPANAQRVLKVWKFFESDLIDSMRPYFADTVIYQDATGMRFQGSPDSLLGMVRDEMKSLDSLRFDIQSWESVHASDRNEDWVRIWARERVYPRQGKPDTTLMQENWLVVGGRVAYFDQYKAKSQR
jgi:hypothetical protein